MSDELRPIHPHNWLAIKRLVDTQREMGQKQDARRIQFDMVELNYRLPDDDPRRFTRADAHAAADAAFFEVGLAAETKETLARLALKILALLPPEA